MSGNQKLDQTVIDELVAQAIELDEVARHYQPLHQAKWRRARTDNVCEVCGHPTLADLQHTYLITPALGGSPGSSSNWVILCRSCNQLRKSADVLAMPEIRKDIGPLSDELLARRMEALESSYNHLTRHSPKSNTYLIRNALRARHAFPRFRCYGREDIEGEMGYLLFTSKFGDGQSKAIAKAIARFGFESQMVSQEGVDVYAMSIPDFKEVVWELIERNAWVVPIGEYRMTGIRVDDYWFISRNSVLSLKHRRYGKCQTYIIPWKPKRYAEGKKSRYERVKYMLSILPRLEEELIKVERDLVRIEEAIWRKEMDWTSPRYREAKEKVAEAKERIWQVHDEHSRYIKEFPNTSSFPKFI